MEKIARTLRALDAIIASGEPLNTHKIDRHWVKVDDAKRYKEELEDALRIYGDAPNLVARNTFERIVASSDFVELDEMQFIRVATVTNFPFRETHMYMWLTPVNEL